eukprot:jgi/Chrzof1/12155/Cz06g23050.t1
MNSPTAITGHAVNFGKVPTEKMRRLTFSSHVKHRIDSRAMLSMGHASCIQYAGSCKSPSIRHKVTGNGTHLIAPKRHVTTRAVTGISRDDLLQQVQKKEAQLSSMFESGQPMPKASIVAALRSEIAALKDQMDGREPRRTNTAARPVSGKSYANMNGAASSFIDKEGRTADLARRAYQHVEAHMQSSVECGAEDDADIAHLEAENTLLRAQAHHLLMHQQQLEALLDQAKGDKPREVVSSITQDTISSRAKDIFMQ